MVVVPTTTGETPVLLKIRGETPVLPKITGETPVLQENIE